MKLTGRICLYIVVCFFLLSFASTAQQPPVPPKVVSASTPGSIDRMFSVGVYDWLPFGQPGLRGGVRLSNPAGSDLDLPKDPKRAWGIILTVPTKGSTRLDISYLTLRDSGNAIASHDTSFLDGTIPQNEPMSLAYKLRNVKVSWNYLTYPNPPDDAKFRLKTLWELQFLDFTSDVVLNTTAPDTILRLSRTLVMPTVGLGVEIVPSRHFRLEARGSGMGLPNRSAIVDAEATAVVRVKHVEVFAGGKLLYFRTSPQKDTFFRGKFWGPQLGLRWVFR